MTKISKEEIAKVASLSRVEMKQAEIESMQNDLANILDFVSTLDSIDTKEVRPTAQVTGLTDVWREDKVVKSEIDRDTLLSNAPEVLDGQIKVNKVL